MIITTWRAVQTWFLLLLSLVLAFPILAGTAQDDPAVTPQEWEVTVENLMSAPWPGLTRAQRREALLNRAWTNGTVPVIVRLKEFESALIVAESEVQTRRATKRRNTLAQMGLHADRDRSGQPVKPFSQMGGFAMQADVIDVLDLLDNPEVLDVVEDVAYPPALLESVPLIGAVAKTFAGYSGQGQVIAILDSGVDKTHTLLASKVVAEACYSTNNPSNGIYSLCPGGVTSSTAKGSGMNCTESKWGSRCNHGTHVAGIAAGNSSRYSGVAKDARLIAIQIYSGFPSSSCGTPPCVNAYTSDIIRGLERVYALTASYSIASANLSLGGGAYTSPCDSDPLKPAIDRLRSAGIATVIPSVNDGNTNAISAPSCISSAISVGATCDSPGASCAGIDAVASYSNSASFLSLLAPGSQVTSAVPGGKYATWNGTSMAAPHVAGAWAVLKQAKPNAGVDEVLAALQASGKPITDLRNAVTTPRIQPAAAIALLAGPAAPTLNPATSITKARFLIKWAPSARATGYRLDVSTSSNFVTLVRGYNNLNLGSATLRLVSGLKANTNYYARLRAYNQAGTSANSQTLTVRTAK